MNRSFLYMYSEGNASPALNSNHSDSKAAQTSNSLIYSDTNMLHRRPADCLSQSSE